MRAPYVSVVPLIAAVLFVATSAWATPGEGLLKAASKFAVPRSAVFSPDLKPKRLCHCPSGGSSRRIGFLVYDANRDLLCGIPSTVIDGNVVVIDFNGPDFQLLRR